MGWTAPRDWSAISSGIVTASSLNTDVRDNMLVLGTHTHTGAAGFGASSMTGLTLAALVTLTFADQEENPDAAGELQRNGNDLKWYGSSVVNLTAADASAGTASLRSLGTTSVKAAAGNHTHTLSQEFASDSAYTTISYLGDNSEHTVLTVARAMADASNALFVAGYVVGGVVDVLSTVYPAVFRIRAGASQVDTVNITTNAGTAYMQALVLPASTSSVDYKISVQQDRSGYTTTASCVLALLEVTF